MDIGGERWFDSCMKSHLVGNMSEVGTPRIAAGYDGKSLGKTKMREVLFLTQRVDYEDVERLEFRQLAVVDVVHVGKVSYFFPGRLLVETVAQDWEIFVHAPYGGNGKRANSEGLAVGDIVKGHLRKSRVDMWFKNVVVVVTQRLYGYVVGIDLHIALLNPVEGTNIIDATHMVAVGVGDKDSLQMAHIMCQHLAAEIGSNVNQDVVPVAVGNKSRGTKTLVVRV